jgi:hypothetical protein
MGLQGVEAGEILSQIRLHAAKRRMRFVEMGLVVVVIVSQIRDQPRKL